MGLVTMSPRELERLALMRRIAERRTTQRLAAEQLGLTVRQVERLHAAYKARGAEGLVSRKRGAPSNRRLPPELRELAIKLVRGRYPRHPAYEFDGSPRLSILLPTRSK